VPPPLFPDNAEAVADKLSDAFSSGWFRFAGVDLLVVEADERAQPVAADAADLRRRGCSRRGTARVPDSSIRPQHVVVAGRLARADT
jgi:hypothetical protein